MHDKGLFSLQDIKSPTHSMIGRANWLSIGDLNLVGLMSRMGDLFPRLFKEYMKESLSKEVSKEEVHHTLFSMQKG